MVELSGMLELNAGAGGAPGSDSVAHFAWVAQSVEQRTRNA